MKKQNSPNVKKNWDHKSLHVLLADDDEDDRELLREAIELVKVDIALHNFANGDTLMQHLSQCNDDIPDLIFLDLNMPRKNGIECLVEIRTQKKFTDTVIAIYSTSAVEEDIDSTFHAGANIYIRKPKNFEVLKKVVSEVLKTNWQYHTSRLNRENFVMLR